MSGIDYALLDDAGQLSRPAHGWTWPIHPLRALAAGALFLVGGGLHQAISKARSDGQAFLQAAGKGQGKRTQIFKPKDGLEAVQPGPPGPLMAAVAPPPPETSEAGPSFLFIYDDPVPAALTTKGVACIVEEGWIYGARVFPSETGKTKHLARLTGEAGDLLKGHLLSWTPKTLLFPVLEQADKIYKLNAANRSKGAVMRGVVMVVREDGSSVNAFWYYLQATKKDKKGKIADILGHFPMKGNSFRYSRFVPRVYNLAVSLGFEPGKIMPSRAFCSDENQGYPIILLAKHFGTFPFNHGRVGGVLADDRHGPHAHHGKDLVIIQASHVGYDPDTGNFGTYRRLHSEDEVMTTCCGKISHVLDWYIHQYEFAAQNILLREKENGQKQVVIDNTILYSKQGLHLNLHQLARSEHNHDPLPKAASSTAKIFEACPKFIKYLHDSDYKWKQGRGEPIGSNLHPDMFYFEREVKDPMEVNLITVMPYIVTSTFPALTAAQANTQVEFDRAFRTMQKDKSYRNKRILFISGLHVDISPQAGSMVFPLTYFIPWAAWFQDVDGHTEIWEYWELYNRLFEQSTDNPHQVDMEDAIDFNFLEAKGIRMPF